MGRGRGNILLIFLSFAFLLAPIEAWSEEDSLKSANPPGLLSDKLSGDVTIFPMQDVHIWKRYVRDFRHDHHFSFIAGVSQGQWRVARLGGLQNQRFEEQALVTRFQYSFHLPIYRGLGYLLGSSIGYEYGMIATDLMFDRSPMYLFPTVQIGLVYNFTPGMRTAVAIDYGISRIEHMGERGRPGDSVGDRMIGANLTGVDIGWSSDYFLTLNWALKLDVHWRSLAYAAPLELSGQAVDASFSKSDRWIGLGLLYHLL